MKKKIIFTAILFSLSVNYTQAQIIKGNDTLYLNYLIAPTEFGEDEEGLIIYAKNNELSAIGIRYNNSSTSFLLNALTNFYETNNENHITFNSESEWDLYIRQRDSLFTKALIDFYEKNKSNYTIIKTEWVLSKKQLDYISKILDEIKTRPVEENVFSNAGEHYAILTKNENYVFIDRTGSWNKFLEIKKVLEIEQQPKKLKCKIP